MSELQRAADFAAWEIEVSHRGVSCPVDGGEGYWFERLDDLVWFRCARCGIAFRIPTLEIPAVFGT